MSDPRNVLGSMNSKQWDGTYTLASQDCTVVSMIIQYLEDDFLGKGKQVQRDRHCLNEGFILCSSANCAGLVKLLKESVILT